jgi:hypothetical protein
MGACCSREKIKKYKIAFTDDELKILNAKFDEMC